MKHVFVTGGTGLIGLALIQQLINKGIRTTVLTYQNSTRRQFIPKSELVNTIYELHTLPEHIDTFFHLGWRHHTGFGSDPFIQSEEIDYTLKMVDYALTIGCKTFIGAGSQAELRTTSPYGVAKLAANHLSRMVCERDGIRHCWARIYSIYGPHDKKNSGISYCIESLLNNKIPCLTKGEQLWDYMYSADCANALISLAEFGHNGKIYNVASGQSKPTKEYFEIIRDIIDPKLKLEFSDTNGNVNLCPNINDLILDTGFQLEETFESGIRKTIDWYRGRANERRPD